MKIVFSEFHQSAGSLPGNLFDAIATTDAPKGKGGEAVAHAARIKDLTMLNVDDAPDGGKKKSNHITSAQRSALEWMDREVWKARAGVTTQIVELTPALASALLLRNAGNRKISDSVVDAYVRDIESGDWSFNGQTIIVSADGMLNDGQHRCTAVVMSNKPIRTVLVIGVPRETRMTVDQGRNRRASDFLAMDGYVDTSRLATTAGFCLMYQTRGNLLAGGSGKPTKTEIRRFVEETPLIVESVSFVGIKGAETYGSKSVLGFCHFVIRQIAGRQDADDFIRSMIVGDGLLARDPVLYCRNRLVAERDRLRPNDRAELIFRAWNARRTRRNPSTLPVLGGALPILER